MAKDLLDTLETHHRSLERMAGALSAALAGGDAETARRELIKLCALLEAHVQLENEQFYPALVKAAEASASTQVAALAKMFQTNMVLIAEGLSRFCARWREDITDPAAFAKEWSATLEILGRRMSDEEQTLHPMFRKHAMPAADR